MNKSFFRWTVPAVLPALVCAFTIVFSACDSGSGGSSSSSGGKLTITGAEALNGKYVIVTGYEEDADEESRSSLAGGKSIDLKNKTITGVQVSNGSVAIPLYWITGSKSSGFTATKSLWVVLTVLSSPVYDATDEDPDNIEAYYDTDLDFVKGSATVAFSEFEQIGGLDPLTGTVEIIGEPQVGVILQVDTNDVDGSVYYSYSWWLIDSANSSSLGVQLSQDNTYEIRESDIGKYIRVQVYDGEYEGYLSDVIGPVVDLPALTGTVTISGTARVGEILTANTSTLQGSGALTYNWQAGSSAEGSFADIDDATADEYTPVSGDEGKYIKVSVRRTGYKGTVTSAAVGPVLSDAPPAPTGLTASGLSSNSLIRLSWTGSSEATEYKVYRSSSANGEYSLLGTATETSFDDVTISVAITYYYKVSAVNSEGKESALSESASASIVSTTKKITSFKFVYPSTTYVTGTISGSTITVTKPSIANLTQLVPTIEFEGKSLSPESGLAQDFTNPVTYTVTAEDNSVQTYTVTVNITATTLAAALTDIKNNWSTEGTENLVLVRANESLSAQSLSYSSNTVKITLKSDSSTTRNLSLSGTGSLFTLGTYVSLTLDSGITLTGSSSNNAPLVVVNGTNADLLMKSGSTVTGNTYTGSASAIGGGIAVTRGNFTLDGGTISGNKVVAGTSGSYTKGTIASVGGGVSVGANGTFTLKSGSVTGNESYSKYYEAGGGGIYVAGSGKLYIEGGSITSNKATSEATATNPSAYGGGVFVSTNSYEHRDRLAVSAYGGGVFVSTNSAWFAIDCRDIGLWRWCICQYKQHLLYDWWQHNQQFSECASNFGKRIWLWRRRVCVKPCHIYKDRRLY